MAVSIVTIDQRNGTGVVVRVTATAGETVFAVQQRLPGQTDWTASGSLAVAGDLLVAPPTILLRQAYQFRATWSAGASETAPKAGVATEATDELQEVGLLHLTCRIIDRDLDGIGNNVYAMLFPTEQDVNMPCAQLHHAGVTERVEPLDDSSQRVEYPVIVDFCDRNDGDYVATRGLYTGWRQTVIDDFRRQPASLTGPKMALPPIWEISRIKIEPRPIIDPELPAYQFVQSGLLMWLETFHDLAT